MKEQVLVFLGSLFTLLLFSFVANLFVLVVILKSKPLRRKPSVIYIINGAVANLLFLVIVGSSAIYMALNSTNRAGTNRICGIYDSYFSLNAFVMTYTIIAIALDKYYAIRKPFLYRQYSTTRNSRIISILSWLVAVVFCVPKFLTVNSNDGSRFCYRGSKPVQHVVELVSEVIHLLIVFLLPCIVIFVVYGRLIHRLWISNQASNGTNAALLKSRRKLTKLTLTVTVLFVLSWIPHSIETAWWCFGFERSAVVEWFKLYASLFLFAYSAVSPVIYTFFNEATRQAAKRMACCLKCLRCLNNRRVEVAPAVPCNNGGKERDVPLVVRYTEQPVHEALGTEQRN